MSAVFDLTQALMRRASVTPDDAGCQELIAARLELDDLDVQFGRRAAIRTRSAGFCRMAAREARSSPKFVKP